MDIWRLWGKTDRSPGADPERVHPLICHMIDVGEVVGVLWSSVLTDPVRYDLAARTGWTVAQIGPLLQCWGALHDLGKASPAFQRRHRPWIPRLRAEGLSFRSIVGPTSVYHGQITARALGPLLRKRGLDRRLARAVARVVGGHHGSWSTSLAVGSIGPSQLGNPGWDAARDELVAALDALYRPETGKLVRPSREGLHSFCVWFSGLVSVADWLGSMEEFFPFAPDASDIPSYACRAHAQACRAIARLGWTTWRPPGEPKSFRQLFPWPPSPMQARVVEATDQLRGPGLVILEAPTGSGKTEAALYLADRWAYRLQQRGLYVAMPTMATSNQMHARVTEMLRMRYGRAAEPLLVHSQARWQVKTSVYNITSGGERDDSIEAMTWFLPRKRSLLAPLGVGTVDQALLSVLQTRHFFVRLFGLAHKTVIFDEVHAYDTYMSTLFERLLSWLHQMGSSVVLLSATLPQRTRRAFLRAYGGDPGRLSGCATYPAVTWVAGEDVGCEPLPTPDDQALGVEWIGAGAAEVVAVLGPRLTEGGCAAVICNTVRRAQEVYLALKSAPWVADSELILFHARYPFKWRQEIEQRVLGHFCREGTRPERAIVVATQVIEQSLDLDFDVMISDIAPIDLLLQRAGRMHRHAGRVRPKPLSAPILHIACDEDREEGLPDLRNAPIYDCYVLLRTYATLRSRSVIHLPADTQALIESVYGDEDLLDLDPGSAVRDALQDARDEMARRQAGEVFEAQQRLIPKVDAENLLSFGSMGLAEDDTAVHQTLQALTRLGPPSITLICLHQTARGLALDPHGVRLVDLLQEPTAELTQELVRRGVAVSHRAVYRYFAQQEPPVGWSRHPLLRFDRPAVFVDGRCPLEGQPFSLVLSRELGLEIIKEEQ